MSAIEGTGRLGNTLDLIQKAVPLETGVGIFQRVLGEHDHETGAHPWTLTAQDTAHALHHLAAGPTGAHHDAQVGVGHINALVKDPGGGHRVETAGAQVLQDVAAEAPGRAPGDQLDGHQRIKAVDGVIGGPDRLGEQQRPIGRLDSGGKAAQQLVLAAALGHDEAAFGEGVEVVPGRPTIGAGVVFGQVTHCGQERPEGFEGHPSHRAQVMAGAHQLLLGGDVLGPFLNRKGHPHKGHPGSGADPVGDGGLETVAVADSPKKGQQQIRHRVVGALQGGGQTQPLLVLGQQGPPQHHPAQAMAFIHDEQPAGRPGGDGLVGGGGMTGGHQQVTVRRLVLAAISQTADAGVGQGRGQTPIPLFHQHSRGNQHQHETSPPQRVGGGRDGHIGLARPGHGLDHPPPTAGQPADQGVELPAIEIGSNRRGRGQSGHRGFR